MADIRLGASFLAEFTRDTSEGLSIRIFRNCSNPMVNYSWNNCAILDSSARKLCILLRSICCVYYQELCRAIPEPEVRNTVGTRYKRSPTFKKLFNRGGDQNNYNLYQLYQPQYLNRPLGQLFEAPVPSANSQSQAFSGSFGFGNNGASNFQGSFAGSSASASGSSLNSLYG